MADGRTAVQRLGTDSVDVYVGDAFGGVAVPWHLTTRETFLEVDRVLRPDGLVVLNVIDYRPLDFARAELATVASVFEHVALMAGSVASPAATSSSSRRTRRSTARRPPRRSWPRAATWTWCRSPRCRPSSATDPLVLTDDHAPVDQLSSTTR